MFKLVPAAQDVSICSRCQYRLSVRQGPQPGHRRRNGYQQLRRFTSGASLQQQPASVHYHAAKDNYLEREAPIRYSSEEPVLDSDYRHRLWPPKKDSLGLHVLGEPAEVLILRDKHRRFQLDSAMAKIRASGPDKNPDSQPISSSEMLEEIDAERGKINNKEACKNIERVRELWAAKTNGDINQDQYSDLVSRLQVGFTREQLEAYLARFGQDQTAELYNLGFTLSSALYARSSWRVLGSIRPSNRARAPILRKTKKKLLKRDDGKGLGKDALAKIIIRQCWNIKSSSQDSSLGELDIRLQDKHFDLILNHKRDILKLMSRSYDSKVEAWPHARIIRITADYDNCVDIVKLMFQTVKSIKTFKLDLDHHLVPHRDSTLPQTELDEYTRRQIERYTNTLVRPSYHGLFVHYLGPDDTDLLETQRLIHQMLRPDSTQVPKLAWSQGDKPTDVSLVPVLVGSRLSMLSRKRQWSRWSSPQKEDQPRDKEERDQSDTDSTKSSSSKDIMIHDGKPLYRSSPYEMIRLMHGRLALDTVKSFFVKPDDTSYRTCSTNTPYWMQEIEYHDSVTFGQVVFPPTLETNINKFYDGFRSKIHIREMASYPLKKWLSEHREFVPLVPGLLQTLESIRPLKKSQEYLQVRLFPSSKNTSLPVPIKALPDLEIKIVFNATKKTVSIKDVRLVTRIEKDYLQPQSVVDLRFIRKQCVYANAKVDPCIATFVRNSNLKIWGTERLSTPLGLSLSIPALAVQSHRGFDPKAHESLLVDYASLGLEHRSSLRFLYQDIDSWPTLSYTNVEAGRIGGRRDELSLHSHRFVSEQQQQQQRPSTTSTDPDRPSSSAPAVDTETETLSEDDHAAIFFHKTAALVKSIEQSGRDGQVMPPFPETKRWRKTQAIAYSKEPEHIPPMSGTFRRCVSDLSGRRVPLELLGKE